MDIKSKVISALRWTAIARFSAQLMTWAVTIVVIRLLSPADYGLMAMSEVFFALLMILSDAGLGSALIQAAEVSERQVRQVFGALCLINGGLFALLVLAAPMIGAYYQEPRVVPIMRVLAIGFIIVPAITIPSALLSRGIDFKRKSIVEFAASALSALSVLAFAAAGLGVWALVAGRLLNLLLQAVGLNLVRPFLKLPLLSFQAASHLMRFGGLHTLTAILWSLYSQADIIVAGRAFDAETLGYYAIGLHLASLILVKVMPLLNEVALPAYARLQHDPSAVAYYFLKVVRLASLPTFPAFVGLASVAPEFVRLVLGPRYEAAIVPLTLLCTLMPLRLVSNLFPAAIFAMGRPSVEVANNLFGAIVMPVAFVTGVQWGLLGLCLAWLVGYPIVFVYQLHRSAPAIHVRTLDVLRATGPMLSGALLMALAVWGAKRLPLEVLGGVGELVLLVLVGIIVYAGYIWALHRELAQEAFAVVRAP